MPLTLYNGRCCSATDVCDLHSLPLTAVLKPDFECSPSHECASSDDFGCWGAGINTIIFYAPQLFLSLGVRTFFLCTPSSAQQIMLAPTDLHKIAKVLEQYNADLTACDTLSCGGLQGSQQNALIATVIVGLCNHFSTYISFWLADHFGRRFLFLE